MATIPSKIPSKKPVNLQMRNRRIAPVHLLICVLAVVIAIGSTLIMNGQIKGRREALDNQAYQIRELENKVQAAELMGGVKADIENHVIQGLDNDRVGHDVKILTDFLNACISWNSYDGFQDAYEGLLAECETDKDTDTLQTFIDIFFPEDLRKESARLNSISQQGLAVGVDNIQVYTRYLDQDVYYYMCIVDWSAETQARVGNQPAFQAHSRALVLCGVDPNSRIRGLEAHIVAE